jgi:hypothetical protein
MTETVKKTLTALRMEGQCVVRHTTYLKKRHYRYCPWCGVLLEIRHHCEHCDHDFMSDEAFGTHLWNLAIYKDNPCPNAKGRESHPSRYLPRRRMMLCPTCNLEYKIKEKGVYTERTDP